MESIMNKLHRNRVFVCLLIIFTTFLLIYQSAASANAPFMDYWKYIDKLVDKMFMQGVTFNDLYTGNGIHRTPVQLLLFLCNVRLFHYNSQIGVYLGGVFLGILCCIFYKAYKMDVSDSTYQPLFYFGIISIVIILFNLNQWEVLSNEFALAFMLRMIAYLLSFILTNNILKDIENKGMYALELALFYIFIICGLSGACFLAYGCVLTIVIIWDFLQRNKNDKRKYLSVYVTLGIGLACGAFLYMYGLDMGTADGAVATLNISVIVNYFKAVIIMLGSSVIGTSYGQNVIVVCGVLLFIFHIFSFGLYLGKGIYKKTYLPFFFVVYSFSVMLVMYMGRMQYGLYYLSSSRYVIDTQWIIIADIWIYIIIFADYKFKKFALGKSLISIVLLMTIIIGVIDSDRREWCIKSYRKDYYAGIVEKMLHIDELSDDQLDICQADAESVRRSIDIMKRYKLGIFQYYE